MISQVIIYIKLYKHLKQVTTRSEITITVQEDQTTNQKLFFTINYFH
jgi:hypothetical protein